MRDLMVALARRDVQSAALVHRHRVSLRSSDDRVRTGGFEFRVLRSGTWLKVFFTPISPAFPWHFWSLIRTNRPKLLHLHMPNPSVFWGLALPSARRLPWVVHWHADVITATQGWLMRLMYSVYRPFEQAVLRRADAIVVTSAQYRDSSVPLAPHVDKCRVVPLGLDAARLPRDITASSPEPTSKTQATYGRCAPLRVLAVGRLTYYKGLTYLLEAVADAEEVHLDVVGHGDQAAALRKQVLDHNLQNRVLFHGTVNDKELARLMTICDCLCLPSIERTEAFGLVLLEAMFFGKAAIVSDIEGSGAPWVVEHEVTGLKVQPANSPALAHAFRKLSADRDALVEMGRRGKARFDRMFEINHAVEGILDTYRAVLSSHGASHVRGSPN